ncbi:MAG: hypothetical protein M1819_005256 [Sarea resinae]|nr:MAG: hypothetical protein M1819_005256 [Sarea resinae]
MDTAIVPSRDSPASPRAADLLWSPEIEGEIEVWRNTGDFPFPELQLQPQPSPHGLSTPDLRLIHHVSSISREMHLGGLTRFTIWTHKIPIFLSIASTYGFVMHSVLALSATHLAWLTDSPETSNIAYQHRGMAMKGLHEAIGGFSRENSDAVLAASILLSWQATDWRGWASLMQGTSVVIDAMQPWRQESIFTDFMDEQSTFPKAPASPNPFSSAAAVESRHEHLNTLRHIHASLQRVGPFLADREEETRRLRDLVNFVESLATALPAQTAEEQFRLLHPLLAWLFWVPVSLLQNARRTPRVMVSLAHLYAVALATEPLFPAVGAAYFSSLSIGPIEEIHRALIDIQSSQGYNEETHTSLALMNFPLDMVANFRGRMGWVQHQHQHQQETYSTVSHSPYDLGSLELHTGLMGVGSSTYSSPFSRSRESLVTGASPLRSSMDARSSHRRSGYLEPHLHPSGGENYDPTFGAAGGYRAATGTRSPSRSPGFMGEPGLGYGSSAMDFPGGDAAHYDDSSFKGKGRQE